MGSIALPNQYVVRDHYIGKPKPIKIIVIGAGISGIAFAYKVNALTQVEYTIYEKNTDVGGTWFESRYPGCSCDIPAHSYSYPWVSNPEWSKVYAGSEEIWEFYRARAKEYGVYEHAKFEHQVVGAKWDEEQGRWTVNIKNLQTGEVIEDTAEVVINCSGALNNWKWPDIPGLDTFKGTLVHTARYPQDLDLTGKRVGVIGAGSSAIQVVPTIQPIVKKLISFIRSPTWIAPQFVGQIAPDGRATRYTEEQKEAFRKDPELIRKYRQEVDQALNARFRNFYKGSKEQKVAREIVEKSMREKLSKIDPALRDSLIPDFDVGCRRVTPGEGYLEALQEDNVQVVRNTIREIDEEGVVTSDGTTHAVDVIIAATGYNTSYVPPYPLIGRNGVDLRDRWSKTGAEAYFTCAVPDMPNYFMVVGPNSPISNGSLMPAIELQLDFALGFAKRIQCQGVKSAVVSTRACQEFNEHKDAVMEFLTFSGNCNSWYKGGTSNGRIVGPWPGSVNHFIETIKEPRLQDFEFSYDSENRFAYMGNGLSSREEKNEPLGWYIRA
ncbi:flavin-binding monooxygenase-like family protein [Paecilomyces variotii No. 5]|uniref:Flavin-binding monooxygenase-like family protein n=1 Tax=Byssochlamys spectabilis (strain No. 5 / NBRC 109023) TaxID=1356009 RepID=V5FTS7_BYSSN|nr:flavin-binding monooxygenase-like family protein [Paecilomyces variotii No. 5]